MRNCRPQHSCDKNRYSEQNGYKTHRFAEIEKQPEQAKHNEHMRQIDLVTILTDFQQWPDEARTSPLCLRSGSDEHAGSYAENRHIQSGSAKPAAVRLPRKDQAEE